jgi:hypothetical protein
MKMNGVDVPEGAIAELCRRHHIRRLALFGSALHGSLRPDSDIDVLVEFVDGHTPGFAFFDSRKSSRESWDGPSISTRRSFSAPKFERRSKRRRRSCLPHSAEVRPGELATVALEHASRWPLVGVASSTHAAASLSS